MAKTVMWQLMLWDNELSPCGPIYRTREEAEKALKWYDNIPIYTKGSVAIEPVYVYDKFESAITESNHIENAAEQQKTYYVIKMYKSSLPSIVFSTQSRGYAYAYAKIMRRTDGYEYSVVTDLV